MTYISLGPRTITAIQDQTGRNTGNWTSSFTAQSLSINVSQFELYHMVVQQVPSGASATIYINASFWGFTNPVGGAEWDPSQPMLLNPGQEVDFFWNVTATGTVIPLVTGWFRYDPAIPGNL